MARTFDKDRRVALLPPLHWHAEGVPPLMSDPEKLILRNLVGNALELTRVGAGSTFRVSLPADPVS